MVISNNRRYALGDGYDKHKIVVNAHRIEIDSASSALALVNITIVLADGRTLDAREYDKGTFEEFPFQVKAILLDAEPQAGEYVYIRTTNMVESPPVEYKYFRREKVNVDSIDAPVTVQGGSNVTNGTVTLTADTPTKIISADSKITSWMVQSFDTNGDVVWLGSDNTVDVDDGLQMRPGAVVGEDSRGDVYVRSTGTPTLHWRVVKGS